METKQNKDHKHNFIMKKEKDGRMLVGYGLVGVCGCGCKRLSTAIELRFLVRKLMEWRGVSGTEDSISCGELVRLVKKEKAIVDYNKFTEGHARLWLDNLDKYI